jgi:hypothetical protein
MDIAQSKYRRMKKASAKSVRRFFYPLETNLFFNLGALFIFRKYIWLIKGIWSGHLV